MEFCLYTWSVRKYQEGDKNGKPTGSKEVDCELERGHDGPHQSEKVTSPNLRSRQEKP